MVVEAGPQHSRRRRRYGRGAVTRVHYATRFGWWFSSLLLSACASVQPNQRSAATNRLRNLQITCLLTGNWAASWCLPLHILAHRSLLLHVLEARTNRQQPLTNMLFLWSVIVVNVKHKTATQRSLSYDWTMVVKRGRILTKRAVIQALSSSDWLYLVHYRPVNKQALTLTHAYARARTPLFRCGFFSAGWNEREAWAIAFSDPSWAYTDIRIKWQCQCHDGNHPPLQRLLLRGVASQWKIIDKNSWVRLKLSF